MKKFDVEKARNWLANFTHSKCMLDDKQKQIAWYIDKVLEAGLVSDDSPAPTKDCGCLVGHECAGDETIRISRSVAMKFYEWWEDHEVVKPIDLIAFEIKQALSAGRNGEICQK